MIRPLLLASSLLGLSTAWACSCFGPQTFCGTLNPQPPQFPDPEWWVPSDVILAVRSNDFHYASDVKVLRVFSGDLQVDQSIRVWGDCGLLCRHYVNGDVGDTVLWAIQHCDLWGNGACGTAFEQASDYQLSICGVYWLGYANGIVSGPLFSEGAIEEVSIDALGELIEECLPTRINEPGLPITRAWFDGSGIAISTGPEWQEGKDVRVTDAAGRSLLHAGFRGARGRLPIPTGSAGLLIVRVSDGRRSYMAKLFAH